MTQNQPCCLVRGRERDTAVLRALEAYRVLSIHQIRLMFFTHATGQRKAQERLLTLTKTKQVKRWRNEEGYYYAYKKQGRAEHLIATNWVRLWMERRLGPDKTMHHFKYEDDYKFIRPDALAIIKNLHPMRSEDFKLWFLEIDLSDNEFDKIRKYNRLFEAFKNGYSRWWTEITREKRFPWVLIVTTTESRKKKILALRDEENRNDLHFEVKLLSEIKGELMCGC